MTAEETLALAFAVEHPEEAALVLERADPTEAAAMLAGLGADGAAVFRSMGPTAAAACAAALSDERLAMLVSLQPLDAAAVLMRKVDGGRHETVLAYLPDDRRESVRRMLSYPEDSAGAIADPLVQALTEDITVAEAQRRLRGSPLHLFPDIYVVSRAGELVGMVAIADLVAARPKAALAEVMDRQPQRLDAGTDLATVAAHPAWRDVDALPVVDGAGVLVGAIRHRSVRRMRRERGPSMVSTIVGLSELYWAGLLGTVASLDPARRAAKEANDVS